MPYIVNGSVRSLRSVDIPAGVYNRNLGGFFDDITAKLKTSVMGKLQTGIAKFTGQAGALVGQAPTSGQAQPRTEPREEGMSTGMKVGLALLAVFGGFMILKKR